MNVVFPFPTKEYSFRLLEEDLQYKKIPPQDVDGVFEKAWQTGVDAANALIAERNGNLNFFEILQDYGLQLIEKEKDNVSAKIRFYSEFYPKEKKIKLYNGSVSLWCDANNLTLYNGKMLILAHEFYHFLEYLKLGWTSRQYPVYMLKIGKFTLGTTGIPALSEIGANAFAFTCFPYLEMEKQTESGENCEASEEDQ